MSYELDGWDYHAYQMKVDRTETSTQRYPSLGLTNKKSQNTKHILNKTKIKSCKRSYRKLCLLWTLGNTQQITTSLFIIIAVRIRLCVACSSAVIQSSLKAFQTKKLSTRISKNVINSRLTLSDTNKRIEISYVRTLYTSEITLFP